MHKVVAYDRHELEGYVSTVEREIIASTRVLVSTVGSLLRNTALREVGCKVDNFSVLILDEGTRTAKFELDFLLMTLGKTVDQKTRLALVGDPCQVKSALRTLKCTESLHNSCHFTDSAVNWMLSLLVAEKPDPTDFVDRVDLLNRNNRSLRCRRLACEAVNSLAPLCLPGTSNFWQTIVGDREVWSALRPKESLTQLERYLTEKTDEVVSVRTELRMDNINSDFEMTGYLGKSRYDADVALYAAMAAVVVGVEQVRLRHSYNLAH